MYVTTSQPSTAALQCAAGHLVSTCSRSLVINFGTHIEVWQTGTDGLQRLCRQKLRGRISDIQLFRPGGRQSGTDLLFVLMKAPCYCVLKWDAAKSALVAVCSDVVQDVRHHRVENGELALIAPSGRLVAMNLFRGLLTVVPLDEEGRLGREPANLRFPEHEEVVDMCFLSPETARGMQSGAEHAVLAVIVEPRTDDGVRRHVRYYRVQPGERELVEVGRAQESVEPTADMLIPVEDPIGGFLLVGEVQITHVNPSGVSKFKDRPCTIPVRPFSSSREDDTGPPDDDGEPELSYMRAMCVVSPTQYFLADFGGRLYSLNLSTGEDRVDLKLEALGYISIPQCIAWLGVNDQVYVGSMFGDAAVVRILSEPSAETQTLLEPVDIFQSLAPIVDFGVVDPEGHGQGTVVSCSGGYRDGSVRILRNGIGISENAVLPDVGAVRGMWSLRPRQAIDTEETIVIAFVAETKVLGIAGEELAETRVEGFNTTVTSLLAANVVDRDSGVDYWVQVTQTDARLVSPSTRERLHLWNAQEKSMKIDIASAAGAQLLVACKNTLLYFEIAGTQFIEMSRVTLDYQIACLHVPPADLLYGGPFSPLARHCAVGLWTEVSVRVLELPSLTTLLTEGSEEGQLPRSLVLQRFAGRAHLISGKADGMATITELEGIDASGGGAPKAVSRKRVSLGTQPLSLRSFSIVQPPPDAAAGAAKVTQAAVFVSSDKPSVLCEVGGKVVVYSMNLKAAQHMCPFNAPAVGEDNCLAFITEGSLLIGSVDGIQKLHMRTIPLGEQPRGIAPHHATQQTVVLTGSSGTTSAQQGPGEATEEGELHHVRLLRKHTYEQVASIPLDRSEHGMSVISVVFADDPAEYIAVGTAYVNELQPEPQAGRILVLEVSEDKLAVVAEKDLKGAATCLDAFSGRLLCGVGSSIQMWRWQQEAGGGSRELTLECSHNGHIVSMFLQSFKDTIVLGDLMRSATVLQYRPVDSTLEEIAHEARARWITALCVVDEKHVLVADQDHNLVLLHNDAEGEMIQGGRRLVCRGSFHLGEQINVFRAGVLVAPPPGLLARKPPDEPAGYMDSDTPVGFVPGSGILFACASGSVGAIHTLPPALHKLLSGLQIEVAAEEPCPSGRTFEQFRSASSLAEFIDGDLVETFTDLSKEAKDRVVERLNARFLAGEPKAGADRGAHKAPAASVPLTVDGLTRVVDELVRLH
eukprot:Hpha_TRINITY_DN9199_c1_g1::TRINITY_DN9199_c1_g1_i1::g.94451::m.94451/K10610/DDB1; DNA damage-binding protein 1